MFNLNIIFIVYLVPSFLGTGARKGRLFNLKMNEKINVRVILWHLRCGKKKHPKKRRNKFSSDYAWILKMGPS